MGEPATEASTPRFPKWAIRVAAGVWVILSLVSVFAATGAVVEGLISKGVGFGLVTAVLSPLIIWLMWREDFDGIASECRYRRALKLRDALTAHEFYGRFYERAGIDSEIVSRLLVVIADFYQVDATTIRPEDNLPAIDGHACDDELVDRLEQEFRIQVPMDDWPGIDGSFDSLVRYIDARKAPGTLNSILKQAQLKGTE
jgi:hypothetical protein